LTPSVQPTQPPSTLAQKRRSLVLVVIFTLISAIAQACLKTGATALGSAPTLLGILRDYPLILGLSLYGVGTMLMILALRHGELSVLWPVISLSYVWVAVISVVWFHEPMNLPKAAGVAVIIFGVAILGRGAHK
jgi:multidrug transporter EmrE-like cation transporter